MEANAKKKFICKFCNKRYPCGKSLGGHIRIHFSGGPNDVVVEEEANKFNISSSGSSKRDSGPDAALGASLAAGQSGYGLRENPKKTRRFDLGASNNSCLLPEKVCRECGKGFQSLKALCGHMACHSRYSSEDHSGSSEKLKDMVMDSQSDTETSAPIKRRRSERTRYKSIGAPSSSFSMANGSLSSASDIEQEQEELAVCLMMLSRDSGFRGCCSLVADSSDINSVVLEAKSSDTKMKIKAKDAVNCVYDNGDEYWEMKKGKEREVMYVESDDSENSDSGYFRYGPKRAESEISVHGIPRTNGEIKKHKVELQPRPDEEEKDLGAELGTKLSKLRRVKTCSGKNLTAENGGHQADRAPTKYDLKMRAKKNSTVAETYNSNAQKTGKSVTRGGNRTNHKRPIACVESVYESGENSIDTEYVPAQEPASSRAVQSGKGKRPVEQKPARNGEKKLKSKKSKAHECPFCFKVFRSGQALGGHKRSHFVGGAGDRTVVIKQEVAEMSMARLIDLNLPAPVDDEAHGFIQW